MNKKAMYWAGPRCFVASMRHFDSKVIEILETNYLWIVYYPLRLVSNAIKKNKNKPIYGKEGMMRTTCFKYVDKCDVIVTYIGLIWDSGTAREVEHAIMQNKPILAWSDSSVIYGETAGRIEVINGRDTDRLFVKTLPFNAMDVAFDRYIELSKLYDFDLSEKHLAREIDKQAREILNLRSHI